MRYLLCIVFAFPAFAKAQTTYMAAYEQKTAIDFSNSKVKAQVHFTIDKNDTLSSSLKDV